MIVMAGYPQAEVEELKVPASAYRTLSRFRLRSVYKQYKRSDTGLDPESWFSGMANLVG
jgi:hypothetical protein